MIPKHANIPAARSWREISQPVKTRAMSSGGRWRLLMAALRTAVVGVIIGALSWAAWMVSGALRENSRAIPAAVKAVAVKSPELVTSSGGVLDNEWLARTLALPESASLMELDLDRLRARVLAQSQVLTATLTRQFPDRLIVKITERMPVARLMVDFGGQPREWLVSQDGVVFEGHGFNRALLDTLPWLAGVSLVRNGADFRPITDMAIVSELLAKAQDEAPHLYDTWHIVSLARLAADHEIEVTSKRGVTVVFNARGSFFMQLARLDAVLERLANIPPSRVRIDLSLRREDNSPAREVPVRIEPLVAVDTKGGAKRPAGALFSSPRL